MRVTRESSRLFGRRYKEQEVSAHLHCVSSQRRTDFVSIFKFVLPFQACLRAQAPMTTYGEEFVEEAIMIASITYNSISLPW